MEITTKELRGFKKARKETISVNDAYNLAQFGITEKRYNEINNFLRDKYGLPCMWPSNLSLKHFN